MSKLLIAALLAVFSTSVVAEWTRVSGDNDSTAYADLATIRKAGNKVKMWSLMDFKVALTSYGGTPFLSAKSQGEYDCKEETWRRLTFIFNSKNMGAGAVVFSSGAYHEEPDAIPPGSGIKTLFKVACGK